MMPQLNELWDYVRLTWALIRDERVPIYTKLIPFALAVYVFSPVDFLPDIPVIGWVDDIALVILGLRLFERVAPEDVVREYRRRLGLKK